MKAVRETNVVTRFVQEKMYDVITARPYSPEYVQLGCYMYTVVMAQGFLNIHRSNLVEVSRLLT